MELWRWPERGLASRGAVVFPHLQNPSCVFSVGEEEEGKARGRGGCAAPRAGLGHSRAWDTWRVMLVAPCHWHRALLGVLCTPRSWCITFDEFCAPQGAGASPWMNSVHPKTLVHHLG